jgi:hypothetical protein
MSISHPEASLLMSLSLEKMMRFMRRYGHHYPVLYAVNRGEPMNLEDFKNESSISIDIEDKSPEDKDDHIYRSAIGFKMQVDADEQNIQRAADEIARTLNPDAIALLIPCLYAEYTDDDAPVPKSLQDEPDSCTILHLCYWLRDSSRATIMMTPFQTEGHAERDDLDWASEDENAINYGLVASTYPWAKETDKLKPKILNPYRDTRKI